MAIRLTQLAAKEVRRVITEQRLPENVTLRVGVTGGGCSGLQYRLGFEEVCDEKLDTISEHHGIRIAVDRQSDLYLDGTEIDFYDGIDQRGFVFNNPKVVKSCGCGSSFQV